MAEKDIRKLAAVMFTDIQGYSASVQDDEKAGLIKVEAHRQHLRHYTQMYHGQVIQYYGDGSLSIYDSVVDAVHCAIAMQKAYLTVDPVPVRIGIHVGDIVVKDQSVFGDGVNIAARIQAVGIPGSVLVSQRVQSEVANHKDIQTKFIGLQRLKNIKDPVGIYAIINEGLKVPPVSNRIRQLAKTNRVVPLVVLLALVVWFVAYKGKGLNFKNQLFTAESISIPILKNFTGDPAKDLIGEMASHWMTKELSRIPDANVVSSESASQMIQLAGLDLTSDRGMRNYASLTGAVNIVDANYTLIGSKLDTLLMSGYIRNLTTGLTLIDLPDVTCLATSPLDCIREMSSKIKGYWVSKDDHVLSPPDYESYKAYLAARGSWRTPEKEFVVEQLNKSMALDSAFIDPYFLMLDFLYNEGEHAAAADTIKAMRKKFTNLDARQANLLDYHHADVSGGNKEAYHYFLNEYKLDSRDLFTNNSAIVLALMYIQDPVQAINFFEEIPVDSLHMDECTYCAERLDLAMWAALDAGNTKLADQLAPKMEKILSTRQSYGMLIMYYVSKNNEAKINELIAIASRDSTLDSDWHYLDFLAGRLFLLQENQTSASKYAKRAIASYGVVPKDNFRMLGRSYYMDQQFDKALEYYQLAHEERPSNSLI
ncbi:MAG: adenylate/guanylate cyclase domain-containing protein, partial [Bacteroidota bacterium]|nr:adenylate/guanylate cyclase domain-containing protein [Bacteroidota bacterium]